MEGKLLGIKGGDALEEETKRTPLYLAVKRYLEVVEGLKKPNTLRKYKAVLNRFLSYFQRGDHRAGLHRRRLHPARPLHGPEGNHGASCLGRHYTACAGDLWIREGALHRCVTGAQLRPNGIDWRIGRRGGLLDRTSDLVSRVRKQSKGGCMPEREGA